LRDELGELGLYLFVLTAPQPAGPGAAELELPQFNPPALFLAVRQDDKRYALYALTHALNAATVTLLAARQLGWPTPQARRAVLTALFETLPSGDLLRALARLDDAGCASRALVYLQQHRTLSAAQAVLAPPAVEIGADALLALRDAITRAVAPLQRYRCAACGFEAQRWFWQCPGCLSWDSFPPQRIEDL
jgi:lipopolysaccharide biosynthesis regulator YciM